MSQNVGSLQTKPRRQPLIAGGVNVNLPHCISMLGGNIGRTSVGQICQQLAHTKSVILFG